MSRLLRLPLIGLTASVLLGSIAQWILFQNTTRALESRSAQRTAKALERLLENAHRQNDDLTLQEAVQGLSEGPGVIFACVVDKDNRVLAHSQPSKLGKTFQRGAVAGGQKLWDQPLHDSAGVWGSLVFSLSKRALQDKKIQEAWLLIMSITVSMLCVLWTLKQFERLEFRHVNILEAKVFETEELRREVDRLQRQKEILKIELTNWARQAVALSPEGLVLLDGNQRLIACNKRAMEAFTLEAAMEGVHWIDIHPAAEWVSALCATLDRPGEHIPGPGSSPLHKISLLTFTNPDGTAGSTWIILIPSILTVIG